MSWQDGYWVGNMIDGYPASYTEDGQFKFPWQKNSQIGTATKNPLTQKGENSEKDMGITAANQM